MVLIAEHQRPTANRAILPWRPLRRPQRPPAGAGAEDLHARTDSRAGCLWPRSTPTSRMTPDGALAASKKHAGTVRPARTHFQPGGLHKHHCARKPGLGAHAVHADRRQGPGAVPNQRRQRQLPGSDTTGLALTLVQEKADGGTAVQRLLQQGGRLSFRYFVFIHPITIFWGARRCASPPSSGRRTGHSDRPGCTGPAHVRQTSPTAGTSTPRRANAAPMPRRTRKFRTPTGPSVDRR